MSNSPFRSLFPCLAALALATLTTVAACKGGSSSSGSSGGGSTAVNNVPITIDGGPDANSPNTMYTTVKLCAHASTTNCQTIDHVQIDTGSYGFRVLDSVLTVTGLPATTDSSGNALVECSVFADGYSWGPISTVDLTVGTLTATSIPIQIIGDPTYTSRVPSSCSNGLTPENTVATFGANAILGIGYFAQDCGSYCTTSANTQSGNYYSCPSSGTCTPAVVSLTSQVQNPGPLFPSDNNGVVIKLPAVSAPGEGSLTSGTLFFGIGTQSNNVLTSGLPLYAVQTSSDTAPGTFYTTYNSTTLTGFIDSGSNGYFFADSSIAQCGSSQLQGFYCPPQSLLLSAGIQGIGANANSVTVQFEVDNPSAYVTDAYYVLPGLAGATGTQLSGAFDWGATFFYGRTVFFAFEGATVSGSSSSGPWVGF